MKMVRRVGISGLLPLIALAQDPVIRTETHLVQINVVVHEKNAPVADLKKEDFTLTDRGRPQTISVFSMSSSRNSPGDSRLPENTFSNRVHGGKGSPASVTVVLLDSLNTLHYGVGYADFFMDTLRTENIAGSYARQQLMKFLARMEPQDRVAIYGLGTSLRVLCDFTTDREQLRRILTGYRDAAITSGDDAEPLPSNLPDPTGTFNPHTDRSNQQLAGMVQGDRAQRTIAALSMIAAHVSDIPGRKSLIWLTASPPFSGIAAARLVSRANIAIYPVDARGLVTSFNPRYLPPGQQTLQELADETGGRAFLNNNDLSGAIRAAMDDSEVSYTLGFYPASETLDGKFHELKVRVNRPEVEVRAMRGYFAVTDTATAAPQKALEGAVESPLESAAIHLLARVERTDHPAALSISGSVDLRNLLLTQTEEFRQGVVDIHIIQQNATGEVLHRSKETLNLKLDKKAYEAYLKSGVFFRSYIEPKEGLATLRVLATDRRNPQVGSLIIPLSQVK